MTTVITGCAIATGNAAGTEVAEGWILVDGSRIAGLGSGTPPASDTRVDASGLLATPGLVNCHHHLYQWASRGLAQDATLFEWLVHLYPIWARIDAEIVHGAALGGLSALARSGCATTTDHHYVFPHGAGDLLQAEIDAAARVGIRFHPCRGSMDLGASQGGLPPDSVVEDRDAILAACDDAITRHHDASAGAMLRIAIAPCSPFSVTGELMRESAELARRRGVRLHTHLAETADEEAFCLERFGCRPVDYLEGLGWLGPDVWLAHCVHLSPDEIRRFGETGTGVAHCPSSNARLGSGIAPVPELLAAGVAVGLGVDGAASNECGELAVELREALLMARARLGPTALTARQALALATIHGARCLGREADLGSLEVGKLADIALWQVSGPEHAGIADPIAALVLGPPRPVHTLMVGGRIVVEGWQHVDLVDADVAREAARAQARLTA